MKTKIDIFSGFLGAGKTTLIKKILEEKFLNEKIVVIENEFGEIGIDGTLLKKTGLEIKEINSGCICCTLAGDFENAIKEIIDKFKPERIIIEPSGVAKLSEIIKVCEAERLKNITKINMVITVVDVEMFDLYILNFGEFFENQIKYANSILLSRTQEASQEKINSVKNSIRKLNRKASIIANPWNDISAGEIVALSETFFSFSNEQNDHAYHHHATEIFQVWGIETTRVFIEDEIQEVLNGFKKTENFGNILRGKGILKTHEDQWILFNYVPSKLEIKKIEGDYTGRLCIIGTELKKEQLNEAFTNRN